MCPPSDGARLSAGSDWKNWSRRIVEKGSIQAFICYTVRVILLLTNDHVLPEISMTLSAGFDGPGRITTAASVKSIADMVDFAAACFLVFSNLRFRRSSTRSGSESSTTSSSPWNLYMVQTVDLLSLAIWSDLCPTLRARAKFMPYASR
jgi:hypothetical protein